MAKHRTHSTEFKRQVAQDFIARDVMAFGETVECRVVAAEFFADRRMSSQSALTWARRLTSVSASSRIVTLSRLRYRLENAATKNSVDCFGSVLVRQMTISALL
jgi:hypothetical protein